MTQELIDRLLPEVQEIIICDSLEFVESKKFNLDNDKSLYLIFGAINSTTNQLQAVTYDVKTKMIEFRLHSIFIYD